MQVYLTFFLWVILLIGTDYWEATPDVCSFLEQSCMHSCNPILLLFFITCVLFSLVEKVSEWGLQKTELNRPWSIFSMAFLKKKSSWQFSVEMVTGLGQSIREIDCSSAVCIDPRSDRSLLYRWNWHDLVPIRWTKENKERNDRAAVEAMVNQHGFKTYSWDAVVTTRKI